MLLPGYYFTRIEEILSMHLMIKGVQRTDLCQRQWKNKERDKQKNVVLVPNVSDPASLFSQGETALTIADGKTLAFER